MAYNPSFDMVEEGTNKDKEVNTESKPTVPTNVGSSQKKSFVGKIKIEDYYFYNLRFLFRAF